MPFDDANWNGDGGEPGFRHSWFYTLAVPAVAGVTVLHMQCGAHIVEFLFEDDLPSGTVVWATIKWPLPMALVTYPLPIRDGTCTVRVRAVPLR